MPSQHEYRSLFEDYLAGITFPGEPSRLYDPIIYSLEGGGKRFRPVLLLAACGVFGDDVAVGLPAAAAIEVFHTFTLLHDDIMDNAPTRRGRPSVFNRWGANNAILSGDVMLIAAYKLLARSPRGQLPALLDIFNRVAAQVCEGQQYDIDFEDQDDVCLDDYLQMIYLKTASLVVGAVRMGAILGGASEGDAAALEVFASELGIAFQLQDDLLDTYGDSATLGKEVGGDILEGKRTFLLIHALNLASPVGERELRRLLVRGGIEPEEKIHQVREIYDDLGVRRIAGEAIDARFASALRALDSLSVPRERTAPLREIAEMLINRNR